jgi:hypothetical protein
MSLVNAVKLPLKERLDFINLSNRQFAEYEINFCINEGYKLKSIGDLCLKEQLIFQQFKNKNQQHNLMLIDSIFPQILADIAIKVLIGKISNLKDYINSKERILLPQIINDKVYFERKITDFINGLLYGEVAGKVIWNGDTDNKRVFCIKNSNDELDFFSIYERKNLFELLISKMKLKIDSQNFESEEQTVISLKFCLSM